MGMFKKFRESMAGRVLRKAVSPSAPIWVRAIRVVVLSAAALFGMDQAVLPNLPGRDLTAGETRMLREIFKDSVDYKKVRIHHSPTADRILRWMGAEAVTHKNLIFMSQSACAKNYASCRDNYPQYVFVHEAAHVWQAQNGLMPGPLRMAFENYRRLIPNGDYHTHYEYSLQDGKPLTAYNVEQQASIITDYYMHVRKGSGDMAFLNLDAPANTDTRRNDYERTLAEFRQRPAYPRTL